MYNKAIINIRPLGFMWDTRDPFLFCVHHADAYPPANDQMGPNASLAGRNLGQDFTLKDGWRMYHGETIPGFPAHPHRGFETVTVVLNGFVDHSDSHGAAGRYGNGDVQWMTAGSGLQHCEMFPLLNKEKENPLELFQIWINLPRKDKFAAPHFKMLWDQEIPKVKQPDSSGKETEVTLVAGRLGDSAAPAPAPDSWASKPQNEVAIWLIKMEAGAFWTLPAASPETERSLYFYKGDSITIAGIEVENYQSIELLGDLDIIIQSGKQEARMLLLQGRPIAEPVAQYGPFVMNNQEEIHQAISDFRRTQFGGWPWPRYDNVHDRESQRFARYADGQIEQP
ncbi:MAG: pirin family protein [Bacteroides sp.]|jgi:redox-sensitive bicupin YhaK (pirin superfamily)|nr:pirin family protein [Bacteroides sp.]